MTSRIQDIYNHLKSKGHEVYFPAQKTGECKKPYLVIKDEGLTQFQQFSTNTRLYAILVYVPASRFGDIEPLVDRIDKEMLEMYPMVKTTHFHTPSFYDDVVKAYMISSQYSVYKFQNRL